MKHVACMPPSHTSETGTFMTGLILLKRNQNLGRNKDLWICKDKASSEAEVGARQISFPQSIGYGSLASVLPEMILSRHHIHNTGTLGLF